MTPLPGRPGVVSYNDIRGSFNKYRSISFGTWKPGEARRFSDHNNKRRLCSEAPVLVQTPLRVESPACSTGGCLLSLSLDERLTRPQSKMSSSSSFGSRTPVPATEDACEKEQQQQQRQQQDCKTEPISIQTPSVDLSQKYQDDYSPNSQKMTISFDPDCYSSAEYLNYCITNQCGFVSNMPLCKTANRSMDALNDRLIHSDITRALQRQKPSTSASKQQEYFNPPLHQRTRSFDGATRFAVIQPGKGVKLSTFGQKSVNTTTCHKTGAFQATKNFLKKLYNNSTTLPKKFRAGKSQQKLDQFKAATSPFYEIRYPEPEEIPYLPYNIQYEVESDNDDEETELDVETAELDSSAPSCSSSTPDKCAAKLMNLHMDEGIFSGSEDKSVTGSEFTNQSYGTASSSGSRREHHSYQVTQPPHNSSANQKNFQSWNDLFGHLKREITEMKVRDQEILESLKTVESQLNYVRGGMDRSKSEYSPLAKMLTSPSTIPAGSRPLQPSSPNPRPSSQTQSRASGNPLRSTFV